MKDYKCNCGCDMTFTWGQRHCMECGALIERTLSISGVGFRCGCIKKELLLLRKQVKNRQIELLKG